MTTRTVTATEARVRLGEILRDVDENGTAVIVERGGRAVAVVIPIEQFRQSDREERERERRWAESWELIRRSREASARCLAGREIPPPEELIREGRDERDDRILEGLR